MIVNEFTLFVISSDEDFVIIYDDYCEKRLNMKYNIVAQMNIKRDEAMKFNKENNIRIIKLPCRCKVG
jgi:hypothetical protein